MVTVELLLVLHRRNVSDRAEQAVLVLVLSEDAVTDEGLRAVARRLRRAGHTPRESGSSLFAMGGEGVPQAPGAPKEAAS